MTMIARIKCKKCNSKIEINLDENEYKCPECGNYIHIQHNDSANYSLFYENSNKPKSPKKINGKYKNIDITVFK